MLAKGWWARQDLNLEPGRYENAATNSAANVGEPSQSICIR